MALWARMGMDPLDLHSTFEGVRSLGGEFAIGLVEVELLEQAGAFTIVVEELLTGHGVGLAECLPNGRNEPMDLHRSCKE